MSLYFDYEEGFMSTVTLSLPKPFRPWMAWVIAAIAIFLIATMSVTRNAIYAPLTKQRTQSLGSSESGYVDQKGLSSAAGALEQKIVHTCSFEITVSTPAQTSEQVRLLAEK